MSSRAAAYTPPPPTQLTSSPRRSSHVRIKPTRAAAVAKVPKAPKLPREASPIAKASAPVAKVSKVAPKARTVAKLAKSAPVAKVSKVAPKAKTVAKVPLAKMSVKRPSAPVAPTAKAPVSKAGTRTARAADPIRKSAPPPAAAALKLLQGGRAAKPPAVAEDTVEMQAPAAMEATEEMPVPELRVAETHRKLAAREKREKKLARTRMKNPRPRKSPEKIAGEKSGIRKKVAKSSTAAPARKPAPPPIPEAAKRKAAPPPVPAAAKSVAPPPPKSVAPPPPRASLASFAKPAPAKPAPQPAKVVHIPSREQTRQFALPTSDASTAAPAIPLSRVAPNDIAVPLVPTSPMPLTQARGAVPAPAAPVSHAAFAAPVSSRQDTQQILLSAPAPFVGEDPDEDLLAPYTSSPLRALSRAITSFFDQG